MLLCPDASQTSPTRTSPTDTFSSPAETLITRGSFEAASGARTAFHAPFASAAAETVCPAKETATVAPASAVPQTGTFI